MIRGLTMNLKAAATARLDLDSDESLVKRAREGDFEFSRRVGRINGRDCGNVQRDRGEDRLEMRHDGCSFCTIC